MNKRILVIDDEKFINRFLEVRLKNEGFDADVAFDGPEALEKIRNNRYDLILSDLMVPNVAGLELIMQIQASELNSSTPIIVLSSLTSDQVIVDVLTTGVKDYILKPFSITIILAKIRQVLELDQTAA